MDAGQEGALADVGPMAAPPTSLLVPPPRTSLHGRAAEVEAVLAALDGGSRLLTLVGPGGIGKSRIAHAVAARREADGATVHVIGLDHADPEAAADAIVAVTLAAGASGHEQDRPPLVVLDTFEPVLDAASTVDAVLTSTRVSLLVTSRARLAVDGERVLTVGPLTPDDACELLVARVAAAGAPTDELDQDAVRAIGAEVGRSPLAVELAAVHVARLGPDLVLDQLRSDAPGAFLDTLGGPAAPGADRFGSVAAAVAWTERLLTPDARLLLHRLSAVRSTFDPATVDALVGRPAFDLLTELTELHLVERSVDDPGLRLPRVVAEYARDALRRAGQHDQARARLVAHQRAVALRLGTDLRSAAEPRAHVEARRQHEALGAVLEDLAEAGDRAAGLEVSIALAPHWLDAGPLGVGAAWLRRFAAMPGEAPPELVAASDAWAAALAVEVGDHAARAQQERAVAVLRAHLDDEDIALHLDLLTRSRLLTGDLAGAADLAEEGLALAAALRSDVVVARSLNRRSLIARQAGDADRAAALALELLDHAERHDHPAWAAWAHAVLADLRARTRSGPSAVQSLVESIEASLAAGLLRPAAWTMATTGGALSVGPDHGDPAESLRWFRRALHLSAEIGHRAIAVCATTGIAGLASDAGLHEEVLPLHRALERHVAPLLDGVVPPHLGRAYLRNREVTYRALDERSPEVTEAVPWSETTLLADRVATALTEALARGTTRSGRTARPRGSAGSAAASASGLSPRELEVLAELAVGGTNQDIAARLYISPKTVMHHTSAIYRKLQVAGRAEAVARAFQDGLLPVR